MSRAEKDPNRVAANVVMLTKDTQIKEEVAKNLAAVALGGSEMKTRAADCRGLRGLNAYTIVDSKFG